MKKVGFIFMVILACLTLFLQLNGVLDNIGRISYKIQDEVKSIFTHQSNFDRQGKKKKNLSLTNVTKKDSLDKQTAKQLTQFSHQGNAENPLKSHTNLSLSSVTKKHVIDKQKSEQLKKRLREPSLLKSKKHNPNMKFSQAKQDETVYHILQKDRGFFVEMGAFDGQTYSNTVWLERAHNWTGLLIEANPQLCQKIDALQRQAWRLCACISDNLTDVPFVSANVVGGIKNELIAEHYKEIQRYPITKVPCFDLRLVLEMIGVHHIDYFSLDIEGGEMNFLNSVKKALLTGEIIVDVWTIEYRVWPRNIIPITLKNLQNLRTFFKEIGSYFEHSKLTERKSLLDQEALDVVFVRIKKWCVNHKQLPDGRKC